MTRTTTLQNPLGRDDASHCKVLVDGINSNKPGAASEFLNVYSARKQRSILRKHVGENKVEVFMEIIRSQAQRQSLSSKTEH